MIRTMDAGALNAIANDPCVRPWLGGDGPIDLTEAIANPDNIALVTPCGRGGYVLVRHHPGLYEAHSLALAPARGRSMLTLAREGFRHLFAATDCVEVWTQCPADNPRAGRWAEAVGFTQRHGREGVSFWAMTYADWVMREADNWKMGQWFHAEMDRLRPHSHPDDVTHDAWVGATLIGVGQGSVAKAVAMYNRFACVAGYVQAVVLSVAPPVVDIGDAVLGLIGGQLQVLRLAAAPEGPPQTDLP